MPFVFTQVTANTLADIPNQIKNVLVNAGWTALATPPSGYTVALRSAADSQGRAVRIAIGLETISTTQFLLFQAAADDGFTQYVVTRGTGSPSSGSTYPNTLTIWASPFACVFKNATNDNGATSLSAFGLAQTPSQSNPTNQPAPHFVHGNRAQGSSSPTVSTFLYGGTGATLVYGPGPSGAVSAGYFAPQLYGGDQGGFWRYSAGVVATIPLMIALATTPPTLLGLFPDALVTLSVLAEGTTVQIGSQQYKCFGTNNSNSQASLLLRIV